jgi:peroxiredoxin Q/BCP
MKITKALPFFAALGVAAWLNLPARAEIVPGQAAPNFSLQGSDGKTYTLSQFKGKKPVVIAWFPKAFTGGCTKECKSLHDNSAAIGKYDVAYFAASVDDAATNKKFAQSLEVKYPILSDPTKATAKAYGVLGVLPYANRWTFYIDKNGKVLKVDKSIDTEHAGVDLQKNLQALNIHPRH